MLELKSYKLDKLANEFLSVDGEYIFPYDMDNVVLEGSLFEPNNAASNEVKDSRVLSDKKYKSYYTTDGVLVREYKLEDYEGELCEHVVDEFIIPHGVNEEIEVEYSELAKLFLFDRIGLLKSIAPDKFGGSPLKSIEEVDKDRREQLLYKAYMNNVRSELVREYKPYKDSTPEVHIVYKPIMVGEYNPAPANEIKSIKWGSRSIGVVSPHFFIEPKWNMYLYANEIRELEYMLEKQEEEYKKREAERISKKNNKRANKSRIAKLEKLHSKGKLPPHLIAELEALKIGA